MSSSQQEMVRRVGGWAGWCSPCGREDSPLVLTRSGRTGLRAWLAGVGDDDRALLLTCNVCGTWQVVPQHEQDDPEVVLTAEPVELAPEPVTEPAPVVEAAAPDVRVVELPADRPADVTLPAPRRPLTAAGPAKSAAGSPQSGEGATSLTLPTSRAHLVLAAAG